MVIFLISLNFFFDENPFISYKDNHLSIKKKNRINIILITK